MSFRLIANALLFYAAWFGACTFAARGDVWIATLLPLAVAAIHLLHVENRGASVALMAVAAALALVLETLTMHIGSSQYAAPGPIPSLAPPWVVALWIAFATLPNLSMRWFRDRLGLTTALAAIFGPLTYWSGSELGGGEMGQPVWIALLLAAVTWMIAAPTLLWLARRWEDPPPRLMPAGAPRSH